MGCSGSPGSQGNSTPVTEPEQKRVGPSPSTKTLHKRRHTPAKSPPNLIFLSSFTSSLLGRRDLGRDGVFPPFSGCLPDRKSDFCIEIMQ